jgi:S1-C subfamily serine protease
MRRWAWLVIGLACAAGAAHAADQNTLRNIQAPSPAAIRPLPPAARSVKFARVVVHLKPEPWASVRAIDDGQPEHLVTWKDGAQEVKPSVVSEIFNDEVRQAGGRTDADSVFSAEQADLIVGVGITEMLGRFCQGGCGYFLSDRRWHGTVRMTARWELYSPLDRRVIATVETSGGFATPKPGIEGDPDRIINEAFRDNVRRLIASEEFRHAVSTPIGAAEPVTNASASASKTPPAILAASKLQPSLSQASNSVAVVFANDGSGSGFLVTDDGYVLTNQHVVGPNKYVKLKWQDGTETLGEVIRTDPRRDVALLKTDAKSKPALALRQTTVQQGETVFAIGTPLGDQFQNTMTKGIVSAIRTEGGQTFIQSDVMVNHGSSGGPLLDEKGRVIGLTVSGQAPNGDPIGLNFFIPIGDALKALSLTPAAG